MPAVERRRKALHRASEFGQEHVEDLSCSRANSIRRRRRALRYSNGSAPSICSSIAQRYGPQRSQQR